MIIGGIDTKDISIVVQGAVDPINTPLCLRSLRKCFPDAEIILSTWEGTCVDQLDCDLPLLNKDPGGFYDKFSKSFVNNTLRQLISTQNGVNVATRAYILKIRSDLIFKSNKFLCVFENFANRDKKYCVFQHRIIFSSLFSKKFCSTHLENQPLPFHISDWLAFGYASDIRFLYDIPLPKEPDNTWYLFSYPYKTVKRDFLHCSHRYSPEQYIFFNSCKKAFPQIQFDHYMDYDRCNIDWSEKIIANNCIILDPPQFRFVCGKKNAGTDYYKKWSILPCTMPEILVRGLYTHREFLNDYQKYCGKDIV